MRSSEIPKEKNEITRLFEKIWDDANDPIEIARQRMRKAQEDIKQDRSFHLE